MIKLIKYKQLIRFNYFKDDEFDDKTEGFYVLKFLLLRDLITIKDIKEILLHETPTKNIKIVRDASTKEENYLIKILQKLSSYIKTISNIINNKKRNEK